MQLAVLPKIPDFDFSPTVGFGKRQFVHFIDGQTCDRFIPEQDADPCTRFSGNASELARLEYVVVRAPSDNHGQCLQVAIPLFFLAISLQREFVNLIFPPDRLLTASLAYL